MIYLAFVDEEAGFNSSYDFGQNSRAPPPPNDYYQSSYDQDDAEESGSSEPDDDDDESFELKPQFGLPAVKYIKDDDGKYICQICNKKLIDKKGLNLHVRLHTGENLKRCNICNRGE